MSDLITRRLLLAAGVWATLIMAGSTQPITVASIAGTLVGSVLLATLVKQLVITSKGAVDARRSSSESDSG